MLFLLFSCLPTDRDNLVNAGQKFDGRVGGNSKIRDCQLEAGQE